MYEYYRLTDRATTRGPTTFKGDTRSDGAGVDENVDGRLSPAARSESFNKDD